MTFMPKYTITPRLVKLLADVEVSRQAMIELPVTARMIASLRETAMLTATHHSTAIEGNRLSSEQVREVIAGGGNFPNREKDEREVRNYYRALEYVERHAKQSQELTEQQVQILHGLAFDGRERATPYRDGQNVIRESRKGEIVYLPPEARDVPALMADLIDWINVQVEDLPIPMIAGLAHYQFATIHPYYDGNGRTARLLTTLILHQHGYGLKGVYSLEEYYARDLPAYYTALTVGTHPNYYQGKRAEANLTEFLEYFIAGMADSFSNIRKRAEQARIAGRPDQSSLLRSLDPRQRQALKLFLTSERITTSDIQSFFDVSSRQARHLCRQWVDAGFLEIADPAPKTRKYRLVPRYEELVREQIERNDGEG